MKTIIQMFAVAYLLAGCAAAHSMGNRSTAAEEGSPLPKVIKLTAEERKQLEDDAAVVVKEGIETDHLAVYGTGIDVQGLDDVDVQGVKQAVNKVLRQVNQTADEGEEEPLWTEDDSPLTAEQKSTLTKLRDLGLVEGPEVDAVLNAEDSAADEDEEEKVVEPEEPGIGAYYGGGIELNTTIIHSDGSEIRLKKK